MANKRRIRLLADRSNLATIVDVLTGNPVSFGRGSALSFEIGFASLGSIIEDLATENVEAAIFEIKPMVGGLPPAADDSPSMLKVLSLASLDDTVIQSTWDDKSKEHANFEFTSSESNVVDGDYYLSISLKDTDGNLTPYVTSIIEVVQDGSGLGGEIDHILTAQEAAEDAEESAQEAETSATNSANSATAAATSASDAATEATNSANSATAAATSASDAATEATNSANSATAAATSASDAATEATNSANSATAAATSATSAMNNANLAVSAASDANNSESNAATAAISSATSAANAATEATKSENSATSSADSLTQFKGIWLGEQVADPTTDLNGDPLDGGEGYWDSTANEFRIYNLTTDTWSAPVTESEAARDLAQAYAAAAGAVPAPQLNPKGFAGGVEFAADAKCIPNIAVSDIRDAAFTLCFTGRVDRNVGGGSAYNALFGNSKGTGSYNAGSFALGYGQGSSNLSKLAFYNETSTSTYDYKYLGYTPSLGETFQVCMVVDPINNTVAGFVNGVETLAETVLGWTIDMSRNDAIRVMDNLSTQRQIEGACYGYAVLNTKITATQAQEIYDMGVSAWLAANPAYQWGSVTPDFESDFATSDENWNPSSPVWNYTGSVWNFNDTGNSSLRSETMLTIGQLYSIEVEVDVACQVRFYSDNSSTKTLLDTIALNENVDLVAGVNTFVGVAQGTLFNIRGISANTGAFNLISVKATPIGCLAHLPMDEGIGYQLHDQSNNHFDALLSESGCTHLQPKLEGYIRDFNVDAYNGGAGDSYLVDSSRAILPTVEGLRVEGWQITNQGTATIAVGAVTLRAGDSLIDIDILNQDTIQGRDNWSLIGSLNDGLSTGRRKLAVSAAGDANATDLDIRVDYKLID